MLSYLLQLKLYEFHFFISFFSKFWQIFISSWILYHLVVFIVKLWDDNLILVMVFLFVKLCKFRYFSFQRVLLFVKKICHFHFISVKEGLDATIRSSFLEKRVLVFVFLLIYLTIQHLEYVQDEVRHKVRVQQVSHFCHPSWFFVS